MKLSYKLWWVSVQIGTISAFAPSRSPQTHNLFVQRITEKYRGEATKLYEENASLPQEYPSAPDFPPRVDEQLELDLMDSERRVKLYEMEVEMIREQLDLKQMELLEEQNLFRDEKRSLMGKIAEFTTTLAKRDEELAEAMNEQKEPLVDLEKQKELEGIIKSLETQLEAKAGALENEKRATLELRSRYDDAADALEYEQMSFEKERKELQEMVNKERAQVKALQQKYDDNGKTFEAAREELMNQIKKEEMKLSDTKSKWKETQDQLKATQEKLEASMKEKENLLKKSEEKFESEKAEMSDEIDALKIELKKEKEIMTEIKIDIEKESEEFKKSKSTLESQIKSEESLIKDLRTELSDQKSKFDAERSTLEKEITSITENLATVEGQLEKERVNFSKEKEMLEKKLADEIRVGRLKKKEMKKRYDEIRKEMTDLWESSKRQARQEQNRLRKKYQRKLETVQAQVAKLDNDLESEKSRFVVEQQQMQAKHAGEIETRDVMISKLEGNVATLTRVIADKDQIIREKNQQIERYETSFRQLAKLGLVVTGNKIKKVAGPLKRFVQNSPPDQLD